MTHTESHQPGERRARREIDLAMGVLIGIRRCSEEEAFAALADATRASGHGLGAVSRALLSVIIGGSESTTADAAVAHWQSVLS
jgi:hypothetical protein